MSDRRVNAAGSPAPTVGIRRNPVFIGPVLSGDFNGDGIADLVGSTVDPAFDSDPAVVTVALGKGDGTFGAPIRNNSFGTVFAVGDFNKDGKLDVLEQFLDTDEDLWVLAGNGDGTFGSRSLVASTFHTHFALSADLDGDGKLDVVVAAENEVLGGDQEQILIVHGNGDLTFDTQHATVVQASDVPSSGTIADVNGDGRKDIVIVSHELRLLTILRNQGSLAFTATDTTLAHSPNGVAAADVNGDGRIDLVVAGSDSGTDGGFHQGFASVLIGTGSGAFSAPVDYPTAPGAWQVVLGDFTRDGILDIATANRSAIFRDDCSFPLKTWDSLSILPGAANGTFAAASNFSIGNQLNPDDPTTDRNSVLSLAAADLDGDRALDLIVSNGTVFINHSADPNWPPTVDAGPDQTVTGPDHVVILHAKASDVDQDMLSYAWFDSGGDSIPPVPSPCFAPHTLGVHTYTVVVDDGHGHTASDSMQVDFGSNGGGGSVTPATVSVVAPITGEIVAAGKPYVIRWNATAGSAPIDRFDVLFSADNFAHGQVIAECANLAGTARSCQWNSPTVTEQGRIRVAASDVNGSVSADSGLFAVRTTTASGLPTGWSHADIGSVGAAGSASFSGGVFTVKGSGADIWGTADAFHYAYTSTGESVSVTEPSWWEITTRVDSVQNVDVWTKAGVMIRESLNANARHASLFVSPGKGIAFQRRRTTGGTSVSTSGPAITAPVWLKLGVNGPTITAYYRKNVTDPWIVLAHDVFDGEFNQVYEGLAVSSHRAGTLATAAFSNVDTHEEPQLTSTDVGTSGGSTSYDFVIASLTAKGADIWGTSDQFRYAWENVADQNRTISARVRSVQNVNAWTKAGVMFREIGSTNAHAANEKFVFLMVTPGKGITMQYRAAVGGAAATAGTVLTGTAPGWVRLSKSGDTYTGAWSKDGVTWTTVGTINVSIASTRVTAGLALTSHSTATATASFDDLRFQP